MSEPTASEMPARPTEAALTDRVALGLLAGTLTLMVAAGCWADASFFLRDDFLNYYLGGFAEISRALSAGEFPLLTQGSWQAGALGGEYQFGLFSPVLLAANLMLFGAGASLQLIATALVWLHLLILASGAYRLARGREHSPELSLMVALAASLNGWIAIWGVNWFGALAAIAWLPWAWWALEREHFKLAGVFLALLITAGFPHACLMAGFVVIVEVGRRMIAHRAINTRAINTRDLASSGAPIGSLMLGLGLSAPAWLMLVEYSGATLRSQNTASWFLQTDLTVPFKALFGTVLPHITAPWRAPWLGADDSPSIVMHCGLVPVALLATAFWVRRSRLLQELDYDLLVLAVLLLLMAAPGVSVMRWSFRWLPLFFLQLALVAAGAARSIPDDALKRFGRTAWLLVASVATLALALDGDRDAPTLVLIFGLLATATLWWGLDAAALRGSEKASSARLHMLWLVVPISAALTFGTSLEAFPIHHRRVEPVPTSAFDPEITYLAFYTLADLAPNPLIYPGQRYFPGNEPLHAGPRTVNGYSPLQPAGLARTLGLNYMGAMIAQELVPGIAKQPLGPLLRRMAVDGLIVWPNSHELRDLPFADFERVTALSEGKGANEITIYHRRGERSKRIQTVPQARVIPWVDQISLLGRSDEPRLERPGLSSDAPDQSTVFGAARVSRIEEGRHRMAARVDTRGSKLPAIVSFARPWLPGYRATLDGESVELLRLDLMMPAVEVPAGREVDIVLAYRPASLRLGLGLVVLSALAMTATGGWRRLRLRRHAADLAG
ncbi:MAG: hypothetical protein AAF560_21390 [Acidobacteriota bacterium]